MATNKKKAIRDAVEAFKAKMHVECSGAEGAYFAFAITEDGNTGLAIGGRTDLAGVMLSRTLAQLVYQTPGLEEDYIDTVCAVAKQVYRELQEGYGGIQ